jgi:hypothetical protein
MLKPKRNFYFALTAMVAIGLLAACSSSQPGEPEILSLVETHDVPTIDPDAERDSCLDGNWIMPTADLDLFVASMVPLPNMRVVGGALYISFVDGQYEYSGEFTLQIELDMSEGKYMQSDAIFSSGGAYSTETTSTARGPLSWLTLDLTVSEVNALVWRAYKGGVMESMPGIGPTFTIVPPGNAPYRCSDSLLQIDTHGATQEVTMLFQR